MAMRVAVISDIHANLAALDAVLADIDQCNADAIVVCGDLAWGPQPAATMNRLMNLGGPVYFVKGNADREIGERYGVDQGLPEWIAEINEWCADQLTPTQRDFLNHLPRSVPLDVEGIGDVLFAHGSPRSDTDPIRRDTPDEIVRPMLEGISQKTIVCGHTHIQFDRMVGETRIINVGSVGLQSAARGACWALLGPDVVLKETSYDYHAAAHQIRRSGVPGANDFADHILHPPDEGP
ncbi:MAG: metallophosphoesterase [Sulfobacillus benefaciens]|uniref:Metallophosphoesterase n=1 Tax=Sulfobacillus benefaciens TaxID=453960 RepID=A0A2T2XHD8_9FIRM|nr:MAG: metallophosphoesterase [Sulfobacillus benefaciens]